MPLKVPSIKKIMKNRTIDQDVWRKIKTEYPEKDDRDIIDEALHRSLEFTGLNNRNSALENEVKKETDEISSLKNEIEGLEKEKKRLISDLYKSSKRSDRMKEELKDLRSQLENLSVDPPSKTEVIYKENTELVEKLKNKNGDIKKMDLKHQKRIMDLERENNDLKRTIEILEGKIHSIERTNHAVLIKVPSNPGIQDPEIEVIDSRTYFRYRGDPDEVARKFAYNGKIHLVELPSLI